MPKTFTPEEKKKYYQNLRLEWKLAKTFAEDPEVKNKYNILCKQSPGKTISSTSFAFILKGMEILGLDGLPYIDCKTFNGWKNSGFKVQKGETSKLKGIVWMSFKDKKKEENVPESVYPKLYHLFHRTQVEALTK